MITQYFDGVPSDSEQKTLLGHVRQFKTYFWGKLLSLKNHFIEIEEVEKTEVNYIVLLYLYFQLRC